MSVLPLLALSSASPVLTEAFASLTLSSFSHVQVTFSTFPSQVWLAPAELLRHSFTKLPSLPFSSAAERRPFAAATSSFATLRDQRIGPCTDHKPLRLLPFTQVAFTILTWVAFASASSAAGIVGHPSYHRSPFSRLAY